MVDPDRVRDRLARLDPLLARLDGIRAEGESAYLGDPRRRLESERALQLSLQVCIDIGAHLVSELGLPAPDDYRGVFAALRDGGVIDEALAVALMEAAGLRNLLVHGYADLDDHQVFAALERLDDLRAFAAAAARAASS